MSDVRLSSEHLSKLWFAYLFVMFDFRIGFVNLLPNFVGYYILLCLLKDLAASYPALKRLISFAEMMFAYSLAIPAIKLLSGGQINIEYWAPLAIFGSIVMMYLWYTLFTAIGQILTENGLPHESLYNMRDVNIILSLAIFLIYRYVNQLGILTILLVIVQIWLIIWLKGICGEQGTALDKLREAFPYAAENEV